MQYDKTWYRLILYRDPFSAADENDDLCMNQGLFIAIIILLVGGLLASSVAAAVMYRKLQEKLSILNKLNGSQLGHVSMPVA